MEDWVSEPWGVLFIPIWFTSMILLIFSVFICPGLLDKKIGMYRQGFLIFTYLLTILLITIIVCLRLDGLLSGSWQLLIIPAYVCFLTHLYTIFAEICRHGVLSISELICLFSIIGGVVLFCAKLDGVSVPWAVTFVPFWIMHAYWLFEIFSINEVIEESEALFNSNKQNSDF
jgi:hypothetical protein